MALSRLLRRTDSSPVVHAAVGGPDYGYLHLGTLHERYRPDVQYGARQFTLSARARTRGCMSCTLPRCWGVMHTPQHGRHSEVQHTACSTRRRVTQLSLTCLRPRLCPRPALGLGFSLEPCRLRTPELLPVTSSSPRETRHHAQRRHHAPHCTRKLDGCSGS